MFAAYCPAGVVSVESTGGSIDQDPLQQEKLDWLENQSFAHHAVVNDSFPVTTVLDSSGGNDDGPDLKPKILESDVRNKKTKKKYSDEDKHRYKKSKSRKRDDSKQISSRDTIPKERRPTSIFIDEMRIRPAQLFCFDRIPDNNNRCFSSLNFTDIARYHRTKFCLGKCKFTLYMDDNISRSKKKSKHSRSHREGHRYYSGDNMEVFKQPRVKISTPQIQPHKDVVSDVLNQDAYVPLDWSMSEILSNPELEKLVNPLGIYDSNTQRYLLRDKTSDSKTETIDCGNVDENRLRNRTEFFNRHLRENPTDVQMWLRFVEFQEECGGECLIKRTSNVSKISQALVEKKISILEKAIETNPSNIDLRIRLLYISADVLGSDSLKKEWDNLVFVHPNNTHLWRQYMRFVRSQYSIFTVSSVITCFNKCLKILNGLLQGTFLTHEAPPDLQHHMLELIADHCQFLKHVGYSEKATATLQALIEFNLFQPPRLSSSSHQEKLDEFELFWESNGPLIGGDGAVGWASHDNNSHSQTEVESDISEVDEHESELVNWMRLEQLREESNWLPFRAGVSEDSCDDLDRVVLFDDISPCLISFGDKTVRNQLLRCFISYMNDSPVLDRKCLNTHSAFANIHPIHLERNANNRRLSEIWRLPVLPSRFQKANSVSQNVLISIQKVVHADIQSEISSLAMNRTIESVRQSLSIRVESRSTSLKESRSAAKKLLKNNRKDLTLWSLYAEFEFEAGNRPEAERILETALSMNKDKFGRCSEVGFDLLLLVRTYLMHQMKSSLDLNSSTPGDSSQHYIESKILSILHSLSGVFEFSPAPENDTKFAARNKSPATVLKTKICLQSELWKIMDEVSRVCVEFDAGISASFSNLCDYCLIYCLFLLLTTGNITASIDIIDQITLNIISQTKKQSLSESPITDDPLSEKLDLHHPVNQTLEKIYEDFVLLIRFAMSMKPLSNKMLRSFVGKAIRMFPCNCQLLAEMMELELHTILSCDMRRFLENSLTFNTDSCLPAVVYGTASELSRLMINSLRGSSTDKGVVEIPTCGLTHRLRSVFERVLRLDHQRDCLLLWRLYLYFEAKHGSRKAAEAVFYRSIQQCPWAKVLYMDAISYFPEKFQLIVDMMTEKEIRIRLPLEELQLLME